MGFIWPISVPHTSVSLEQLNWSDPRGAGSVPLPGSTIRSIDSYRLEESLPSTTSAASSLDSNVAAKCYLAFPLYTATPLHPSVRPRGVVTYLIVAGRETTIRCLITIRR